MSIKKWGLRLGLTLCISLSLNAAFEALPLTPAAHADEASEAAAANFFKALNYRVQYQKTIDKLIDAQISQQPILKPYRAEMHAFLNKYMSWDSIKDEMIKLYGETFTAAELEELTRFYATPLGQKSLQKMPELMAKASILGQQRVQAHEQEFVDMIEAARKKREAEGQAD